MPHRILLPDDHLGIRRRVRSELETAGFEVCGEAADGLGAVTKTKDLLPDLIILNLSSHFQSRVKSEAGRIP